MPVSASLKLLDFSQYFSLLVCFRSHDITRIACGIKTDKSHDIIGRSLDVKGRSHDVMTFMQYLWKWIFPNNII